MNPNVLFYPIDAMNDAEILMDMFSGAHVLGVSLGSDHSNDTCQAISLKMSDGRTLHLGISQGQFILAEEGLAEA